MCFIREYHFALHYITSRQINIALSWLAMCSEDFVSSFTVDVLLVIRYPLLNFSIYLPFHAYFSCMEK